jgi:HAD superfamily hydrolase (TIGR01509 family)
MKEVRGIIYDCDGVLFDSRRANLAFYSMVLAHFGRPPITEDDVREADLCHTYASADVFRILIGEDRVAEAMAFADTIDIRNLVNLMVPENGIPGVLGVLAKNHSLGLATNRGRTVLSILDHFCMTRYFDKVVTSQDVERPKPSPDMLLLAVGAMGLTPAEVLFVGDSELDRQAACGGGLRFVAYKGQVRGDLVIHEHRDLLALLGLD